MTAPPIDLASYHQDMLAIIDDLRQDFDTDTDGDITPESRISADLSFDSLDVVHMISAIESKYNKTDFMFEKLLMDGGQYVQDLTIDQIAKFVKAQIEGKSS